MARGSDLKNVKRTSFEHSAMARHRLELLVAQPNAGDSIWPAPYSCTWYKRTLWSCPQDASCNAVAPGLSPSVAPHSQSAAAGAHLNLLTLAACCSQGSLAHNCSTVALFACPSNVLLRQTHHTDICPLSSPTAGTCTA
eukprot:GHRR01017628.1.p2 GENE.GHRR01017628.1~~GHRR01017628.1.p2  ORF type:complete len:139 (+),score=12.58 GHRR01017628.1:711-1127(+)